MYTLSNSSLEVAILDPQADHERFGPRYCTGGYIYQVSDAQRGPLLSGPTYPDSFNWFDGQGIPDAFNLAPLRDPAGDPATALIIGVGRCDTAANRILELCAWQVEQAGAQIRMRTSHAFGTYRQLLEQVTAMRRTMSLCFASAGSPRKPSTMRWPSGKMSASSPCAVPTQRSCSNVAISSRKRSWLVMVLLASCKRNTASSTGSKRSAASGVRAAERSM